MKSLIITIVLLSTTTLWAQKACRLKMGFNFEGSSAVELDTFIRNYIKHTDIELVAKNEDYIALISSSFDYPHHGNDASAYVDFEAYPAGRIDYLSKFNDAEGVDSGNALGASVKTYKRMFSKLLPRVLSSCKILKRASRYDGSDTLSAEVGDTFKTSKGAVFTKVFFPESGPSAGAFGNAWRDPSGRIWSETLNKLYQNLEHAGMSVEVGGIKKTDATQACRRVGGYLPSTADYQKLVSYFAFKTRELSYEDSFTTKGAYQFNQLFPWSRGFFWTTQDVFHQPRGFLTSLGGNTELGVRCIFKP